MYMDNQWKQSLRQLIRGALETKVRWVYMELTLGLLGLRDSIQTHVQNS